MNKYIFVFFSVLVPSLACSAVLQGYGEVENCYLKPDKSIPTCDGGAYNTSHGVYYCYIPSMKCNAKIVIEGFISYDVPSGVTADTVDKREDITIVPQEQWYGDRDVYFYCRMTYPYEGLYVANINLPTAMPGDDVLSCGMMYDSADSYSCFQNRGDADDVCWDDYWGETSEFSIIISALFETEVISELPCEIGISKLKLSVGKSFQLYAEKYTQPSLVVQYNEQKCYGKLEPGNASGTLNLKFNDAVWHLVG